MITLKNFNLSRLLSQLVALVCLGRELQGSNVFLDFFGCAWTQIARRPVDARRAATRWLIYSSMTTGVS